MGRIVLQLLAQIFPGFFFRVCVWTYMCESPVRHMDLFIFIFITFLFLYLLPFYSGKNIHVAKHKTFFEPMASNEQGGRNSENHGAGRSGWMSTTDVPACPSALHP